MYKRQIKDIIVKTLIVGQPYMSHIYRSCQPEDHDNSMCYQILGFDIMIDRHFKPWLIEVNVACSLASSSPLDRRVKHFMMTDLLHLVGVQPYDKKQTRAESEKATKARLLEGNTKPLKRMNVFELQATPLQQLANSQSLEVTIRQQVQVAGLHRPSDRRRGSKCASSPPRRRLSSASVSSSSATRWVAALLTSNTATNAHGTRIRC